MRKVVGLLALLTLLLAGISVQAQETLDGVIDAATPSVEYTLPIEAGQTVTITVEAQDSTLDPVLELYSPSGELVAENDDIDTAAGNFNSGIQYTADIAGDYVALVRSFGGSQGAYAITVGFNAAPAGSGASTGAAGGDSESADGVITDDAPSQFFTATLEAGNSVTLTAEATSGDLDTYLIIYAPSGDVIVENDDIDTAGGNFNSQVAFVAPEAGDYEIEVTRYAGTGDFVLTIAYGVFDAEGGTAIGADASEATNTFTGSITDAAIVQIFEVELFANETVFASTEATSGNLDTVLSVLDPNQREIASNDDFDPQVSLNSALSFTTGTAGTYFFVVTRFGEAEGSSTGDFTLIINRGDAAETAQTSAGSPAGSIRDVGAVSAADIALELSGQAQAIETDNFRIYYTTEGEDATTPAFLEAVALAFEEAFVAQRDTLGFIPPPTTTGRYDVYLYDVVGKQENVLGYAQPQELVGDNPNSPSIVESVAATSIMVIDNDYAGATSSAEEAVQVMRATVTHELNHLFQFGYDANEPHNWLFEATASWIEIATFTEDEAASGYLQSSMTYPEACFGTGANAPDNNIMYGTWLYMQSLAEAHDPRIMSRLWENIVSADGFAAVEATLSEYNDTLTASVMRYHTLNLLRAYDVASLIQFSPWLENIISAPGKWEPRGAGVQELGANYYEFALPPGVYDLRLTGDDALVMYAVGINGSQADFIPLEQAGAFDNSAYDVSYVVVFNTLYDQDVDDCRSVTYDIDVMAGSGAGVASVTTLDASNFVPLSGG